MKINTGKFLLCIGIYVLLGAFSGVSAQEMMVGNYRKLMKTDAGALSAAKFAVKAERRKTANRRLSFVSIERAEAQVVAGKNYRICIKVISSGRIENVTVVVYLNPKNKFSLTDWEKGACKIAVD